MTANTAEQVAENGTKHESTTAPLAVAGTLGEKVKKLIRISDLVHQLPLPTSSRLRLS